MFYASYGSFVHRLIEKYYRGEIGRDELPMAFLLGFSSEVKGDRPPAETVKKYIESGKKYFDSFQEFPFQPVSIEQELHFEVGGYPFVAFADYIGRGDGKLAIVDNKSRDLKPRRSKSKNGSAKDLELDEMLMQLYLYSHAVFQNYGEFPSVLCFNCFKSGVFIEEPFDEKTYIKTLDWSKRKIDEIADEEDFRPNIEFFKCKYLCGLHDQCCYYQGGGAR